MTTMLIVSIFWVMSYVGITIYHMRTVPESVSAMVYALHPTWRYLWTAWLWAVSMLLMPVLMERLGSYWQFLGFLWCASMAFCGAMPLIRGDQNDAHNAFGIAAGVLSQVCVFVLAPWWLFTWVVMFIFVMKGKFTDLVSIWYGKNVFVAEVICYVSLVGALLTS